MHFYCISSVFFRFYTAVYYVYGVFICALWKTFNIFQIQLEICWILFYLMWNTISQKLDLQCYSFALSGVTFRWSVRTHWLGWPDFVLGGVSAKGEIYRDATIGDVKKVKKTSPIRDVVWYEKMERRVGTEDIYSVLNHNCRKYSQKEFFYA